MSLPLSMLEPEDRPEVYEPVQGQRWRIEWSDRNNRWEALDLDSGEAHVMVAHDSTAALKRRIDCAHIASDGSLWHFEACPWQGWVLVHEDYDGAPDSADNRHVAGKTHAAAIEELEEAIDEGRFDEPLSPVIQPGEIARTLADERGEIA